jgi:hypothetical protein
VHIAPAPRCGVFLCLAIDVILRCGPGPGGFRASTQARHKPLINSAKVLRKNIQINNLQKKINLFPIGLGDQNGNLRLFYSFNHAASSQPALKLKKKK